LPAHDAFHRLLCYSIAYLSQFCIPREVPPMSSGPRKRKVRQFQANDLAIILGVNRNTIYRWLNTGVLDATPDALHDFLRTYTNWRGRLP